MDVAAAAVKMAHEAAAGASEDEAEIPVLTVPSEQRGARRERMERGARGSDDRGPRERGRGRAGGARQRRAPEWDVTRLYIGAGRKAGVRPGDLVGAIANEVGIDASAVGAIEIADRFSLVEVPEEIAEDIIHALRGTTIKGKRVPVRRDREPG